METAIEEWNKFKYEIKFDPYSYEEWEKFYKQRNKHYLKFQQKIRDTEILMIDYKKIINVNNLLLVYFNGDITKFILDFIILPEFPLYVIESRGMYDGNGFELNSIHINKNDVYDIINNKEKFLDYKNEGKVKVYFVGHNLSVDIIKINHDKIMEISI
jgi:hypothetical protein